MSFWRRWYGPLCLASVGLGATVGALHYRLADVPEAPAVQFVTTTETAPPVTSLVTVTAAPRVETRVLRAEAAVETRTVTFRPERPPPVVSTRVETVTETATETKEKLMRVSYPEKGQAGKGDS